MDRPTEFEALPFGSEVQLVTCFDEVIIGNVVSFDFKTKVIMLDCCGKNKKGICCIRKIINLGMIKDMKVLKEVSEMPDPKKFLLAPDLNKLNQRYVKNMKERSLVQSRPPRGQRIFELMANHYGKEAVKWDSDKIVVLQNAIIAPPYGVDNVSVKSKQQGANFLPYVKNVLARFHRTGIVDEDVLSTN